MLKSPITAVDVPIPSIQSTGIKLGPTEWLLIGKSTTSAGRQLDCVLQKDINIFYRQNE